MVVVSNICLFGLLPQKKWCRLTKYCISTGLKPTSKLPNILMNPLFYHRTGFEILGTLQPLQNTLCVWISSRKKQDICWKFSLCFWIDTSWKETLGWQFFLVGWLSTPSQTQYIFWVHQKGKSLPIHPPIPRVVVNTQNLPAFPPLRMSLMEKIWNMRVSRKQLVGEQWTMSPPKKGRFWQHVGLVTLAYVTHLLVLYHLSKIYGEKNRNSVHCFQRSKWHRVTIALD